MQRKEVDAILDDDFVEFLKQNGLYEDFQRGALLCHYCNTPITLENISTIFDLDGLKFCCTGSRCIELFAKRK
jgi:hypothetical protein